MEYLRGSRTVQHLILGALLVVVYPLEPLFSGNQNVYFLWGMESLLPNTFSADPLLHTPDPYPLFSLLISLLPYSLLPIATTLIYWILNAVYSYAFFGLADSVSGIYRHSGRWWGFVATFLALHSAPIWGTYMVLIGGPDLRWMWDSGIAEQGVLRGYLQPSVFGVFLLLSLHLAVRKRYSTAILTIAPAALLHANYLFLGSILAICWLVLSRFNRNALFSAFVLLMMTLPYAAFLLEHFVLLDADMQDAIQQSVLLQLHENIHLNPALWFNSKFVLQMGVLALGITLSWHTPLRNAWLPILAATFILTALAFASPDTRLMSLNPWRFSVILIPAATATLLSIFSRTATGQWACVQAAMVITVSLAVMTYRFFGNGSEQFLLLWASGQFVLFCTLSIGSHRMQRGFQTGFSIMMSCMSIFFLLTMGTAEAYFQRKFRAQAEQFAVIGTLKGTEPETVYIIPPEWTSFRINALRSVYVDENLVYGPALPGISARLTQVRAAMADHNYAELLNTIPPHIQVKVIAPAHTSLPGALSRTDVTATHSCYRLR